MVCLLPANPQPGTVAVTVVDSSSLDGQPQGQAGTFTYQAMSDRKL
jgi:hypothetical protein